MYPQPWAQQREPDINSRAATEQIQMQQQQQQHSNGGGGQQDEEWKNIKVMLNCILGMVDKTKKALAILQQRQQQQQQSIHHHHNQQHQHQHQQHPLHHPSPFATTSVPAPSPSPAAAPAATTVGPSATSSSSSCLDYLESLSSLPPARRTAAMSELLAATIRNTEERVVEVRRRAEEAVQEVSHFAGLRGRAAVSCRCYRGETRPDTFTAGNLGRGTGRK